MAPSNRAGLWAAAGSVLTAAVSSACCWLPLMLLGFGASAAGIGLYFETLRPYFLVASSLLLGLGFYLNYFRKPKCEPGGVCEQPNPSLQRFSRLLLWLSTAAVLLFAFFPGYVGVLFGSEPLGPAMGETVQVTLGVEGMTCAGCEVTVEKTLGRISGVLGVRASYDRGEVVVDMNAVTPPTSRTLSEAIESLGYKTTDSRTHD